MSNKALWDLIESRIVAYPRNDDDPVVGLDSSRYITLTIVREPEPAAADGFTVQPTRTVDLDVA
jgi:hypothetical protein